MMVISCWFIPQGKREIVLPKPMLRSRTRARAMVKEAQNIETKSGLVHEMGVAPKDINKTIYWLNLQEETNNFTIGEFSRINFDAPGFIKQVTSIIKTTQASISTQPLINY